MKIRKILTATVAAAAMLALILDSQTAIRGMTDGIELCITVLIPSLLPFFFLSILLTGSLLGSKLTLLRPLGALCGIPPGGEALLAVGLLGGYPVGAQNTAMTCAQGSLSRRDGERMISFCNNAGPAFIFGVLRIAFDRSWVCWVLWGIHLVSAVIVGIITASHTHQRPIQITARPVTLTQALQKSLVVMAQVAGWVILFRLLTAYLERWFLWMLPANLNVFLTGLLELSNGCIQLRSIPLPGERFAVASVLLALGGVCVSFQTASVAGSLRLTTYFPGKLLQASFSFLLALLAQPFFPAACRYHPSVPSLAGVFLVGMISVLRLRKLKNSSSNLSPLGV